MKIKTKLTILTLSVCSLAILPAQEAVQEKPAAAKAEELKAETPVEKQVFKMLGLMDTLPEILGSIKDEASLAAAKPKLKKLAETMNAEEEALLKLPVPDNASRTKISKQGALVEQAIVKKMQPILVGMQNLEPAVAIKLSQTMQEFATSTEGNKSKIEKYLKTDEELKKGEK